jgi:hypothetical protein
MNKVMSHSSFSLVGSLWKFIHPYRWHFISASLLRIIGELVWLYPAYALASIATFFIDYQKTEVVIF